MPLTQDAARCSSKGATASSARQTHCRPAGLGGIGEMFGESQKPDHEALRETW
jgi:hypothetical protein